MKKLAIIIVSALFCLNVRAETEWFYAGFTGYGDLDTESRKGAWETDTAFGATFADGRLSVENVAEDDPVVFVAKTRHNGFREKLVLTIESVITCYGYDELPAPPTDTSVRSAVIATDDGEMHVMGYDIEGGTNRWCHTGIIVPFGSEITVRATFAYSNVENVVTYEFNGKRTNPVLIRASEVGTVGYVGYGAVDGLSSVQATAPKKVDVKKPSYPGIYVVLLSANETEYPGVLIPLYFVANSGTVSRSSAMYRVLSDGSLEFADSGKPPRILTATDLKYPTFIRDESDEVRSRYDAWAEDYDMDTESAEVDAYLLDCGPSEVADETAKFMIISIREATEGWVVKVTGDKGEGDRYGNGYVRIRSVKNEFASVSSEDSDFFRAEVVISPP